MIAIVDIDETLSDNSHRVPLLTRPDGTKDWAAFLHPDVIAKDTPIPGAKEGLKHLFWGGVQVFFLTGRNESLRQVTLRWLTEHMDFNPPAERLYMRPDGEITKATEYKGRVLKNLRALYPTQPFLYIDDDKYMWPVAAQYGIVLRAPHCWAHLNPSSGELPPEVPWRR